MELCQNESETTESIKEARAICSHVTLNAKALCFSTIKEAKTTCACTIWEAEAVCSMAIRDAMTQRASQAKLLHRQHGKSCKTWRSKSSERKAEGKLTSPLPARLPYMPVQQSSEACWWLLTKFCWGRCPHPVHLPCHKGPPQVEQQSAPAAPPAPVAKQSPRPKRRHPSPNPVDSMPLGRTTSKATSEGPPAPNSERSNLGTRHSSRAAQKCSARTLTW